MEVKNNNTIITILLMIIIAMLGFFIGYTISKPKSNTDTQVINNSSNNTNSKKTVSKIDATKNWVYDAEYEKNVSSDSYETYYKTYYVKDIIVPFINIDSEYANTSNKEIKSVFNEAINAYNSGINDKTTYVDECNYKSYLNNDNLSVILTLGIGSTDIVHPKYYTYNMDLKTGNKLSYEEIYKLAGFTSDNIESKVETAITNVMKEKVTNSFDTYNSQSINNYKTSLNDGTLRYYLNDNNKLNIIVTLSIPAGSGKFDTIITID